MKKGSNIFDMVNQVKSSKKVEEVIPKTIEFTIYCAYTVEHGPLKKIYELKFHIEINDKCKVISTYETENIGTSIKINDLVVDSNFQDYLVTVGLYNYQDIFKSDDLDWDNTIVFEKCLKADEVLNELYFSKGYAYIGTLSDEQRYNVEKGRIWNSVNIDKI